VRLAATVSTDAEAEEFRQFLDEEKIAAEDRVIRPKIIGRDGPALPPSGNRFQRACLDDFETVG
jgi:hypothetical protein